MSSSYKKSWPVESTANITFISLLHEDFIHVIFHLFRLLGVFLHMKHIDVPVCVCAYAFSSSLLSTSASSVVFSITKDSVYVLSTALAY